MSKTSAAAAKAKASLAAEAKAADALTRRIGVDPARTESYRAGYHRLMWLSYVMTFAIFGLIGAMVFLFVTHTPEDSYFAETAQGGRMQVVGIERPFITQQALLDWAADATTQIMTFGFNDYNDKLSASRNKFTEEGWASFANVLSNTSFFKNMVSEKQLITSVPREVPLLAFEGISAGRFNWVVEVPLLLTVRSGSISRSVNFTARLIIVRVPTEQNPMGIAIDRWISF